MSLQVWSVWHKSMGGKACAFGVRDSFTCMSSWRYIRLDMSMCMCVNTSVRDSFTCMSSWRYIRLDMSICMCVNTSVRDSFTCMSSWRYIRLDMYMCMCVNTSVRDSFTCMSSWRYIRLDMYMSANLHMYMCVCVNKSGHIIYEYTCETCEYRLFYRALLQKRPIIQSILLTKATPFTCETCEYSHVHVCVCVNTSGHTHMCEYMRGTYSLVSHVNTTCEYVRSHSYEYTCETCEYAMSIRHLHVRSDVSSRTHTYMSSWLMHMYEFVMIHQPCQFVICMYDLMYRHELVHIWVRDSFICMSSWRYISHVNSSSACMIWCIVTNSYIHEFVTHSYVCVRDDTSAMSICHLHVWSHVFICACACVWIHQATQHMNMGWLRSVGSIKLYVSFAEYRLFYRSLLQKRPII